ncbi:MAG: hypothetical protein HUU16_06525 [Candidatus Omnitrophica bacterium]|nr:hypothetical protein [bacterium]NUN95809.1 hypothetical protein [Candidatus Omnitrophota bacterium]
MKPKVSWYPFTGHPDADTCWSLSTGPDGRIYAAACAESVPGGTVRLARYNREKDDLDYLFDLAEVVDDPPDSGRGTQCKIHYSFVPSMSDGILYMATHLSGPPIDQPAYSPWRSWHDPERCFRGSALVAFDTKTDKVLWWDTLIPKEGCRCLLIDEEHGLLYAISYPRDHFIIYDIENRTRKDIGRIGSINAQALFLDNRHRVWTTNDDGRLVRYDPAVGRLEVSPFQLPHNPQFQTGWHSVFYDVAAAPDGRSVFGVTWIAQPWLLRFYPEEGEWGRLVDLGPATQDRDPTLPHDTFLDHCGGLVIGGDNHLYYVASRWRDPVYSPYPDGRKEREGVVWRLDPETHEKQEFTLLERPDNFSQYVPRGAVDRDGDLFFGHVGYRPVGIFKVSMPPELKRPNAHLPIRVWG